MGGDVSGMVFLSGWPGEYETSPRDSMACFADLP
jgi:hypothetical protein